MGARRIREMEWRGGVNRPNQPFLLPKAGGKAVRGRLSGWGELFRTRGVNTEGGKAVEEFGKPEKNAAVAHGRLDQDRG